MEEVIERIRPFESYQSPFYYSPNVKLFNDETGTAHMSVIAPNGDAVSVTSSLGSYFGCGKYWTIIIRWSNENGLRVDILLLQGLCPPQLE